MQFIKPEIVPFIWIASGILLMALELLVPGLIVVFFGAGAVLVGLLIWLGLFTSVTTSFTIWLFLSLFLVLAFRRIALKLFPSESKYKLIEDDVAAVGSVVEVIHIITEHNTEGRIKYAGTTWPAKSNRGIIEAGKKARLMYRDNISWIVEPSDE